MERLPGVRYAKVSYREGRGEVFFDPAAVSVEQMTRAIAEVGYRARLLELKSGVAATGPPARDCGFLGVFC
ncbi:MAG: hypothetical protein V3S29_04900 [bacterium]